MNPIGSELGKLLAVTRQQLELAWKASDAQRGGLGVLADLLHEASEESARLTGVLEASRARIAELELLASPSSSSSSSAPSAGVPVAELTVAALVEWLRHYDECLQREAEYALERALQHEVTDFYEADQRSQSHALGLARKWLREYGGPLRDVVGPLTLAAKRGGSR